MRRSFLLALILVTMASKVLGQEIDPKFLEQLIERQDRQIKIVTFSALIPVSLLFIFTFFFFYRRKRESDFRQRELELKFAKSEMEMRALRAQVNPHFIFNCLSSIQHYIHHHNNELAERYLVKFSRLIRQVLEHSTIPFISLEDDLNTLQLYMDLERMRLENHFKVYLNIDPEINTAEVNVPPLLLQPLVENAIWHGLNNRRGSGGLLSITFTKKQNHLFCVVEDNGARSITSSNHQGRSFGMTLVRERLAHHHTVIDDAKGLEMQEVSDSAGKYQGTKVRLRIPIDEP